MPAFWSKGALYTPFLLRERRSRNVRRLAEVLLLAAAMPQGRGAQMLQV